MHLDNRAGALRQCDRTGKCRAANRPPVSVHPGSPWRSAAALLVATFLGAVLLLQSPLDTASEQCRNACQNSGKNFRFSKELRDVDCHETPRASLLRFLSNASLVAAQDMLAIVTSGSGPERTARARRRRTATGSADVALLHRLDDGLCTVHRVELLGDMVEVVIDRVLRQAEDTGDLGAGLAGGRPAQTLDLALGQDALVFFQTEPISASRL